MSSRMNSQTSSPPLPPPLPLVQNRAKNRPSMKTSQISCRKRPNSPHPSTTKLFLPQTKNTPPPRSPPRVRRFTRKKETCLSPQKPDAVARARAQRLPIRPKTFCPTLKGRTSSSFRKSWALRWRSTRWCDTCGKKTESASKTMKACTRLRSFRNLSRRCSSAVSFTASCCFPAATARPKRPTSASSTFSRRPS